MKKFFALGLIFLLSLVVLTGCGGDQAAEEFDTVAAASLNIRDEEVFKKSIAEDGKWIICTIEDLEFAEELVVEGEFYDKDNPSNGLYRKIAPYTQDNNHNILDRFSITAPKMTIKSPNTRFQAGTFVGDIYVEAAGFSLSDARVEGNVYFASEDFKTSADISVDSTVTGVIEVK